MALTVATLPTTHERGSEPTPLAAARASAPTEVIRIGGIIRSRPIRPHSVFALRFMQQRWCVAIPWLGTLGKHFYFLFAPPPAESDSQVALVTAPIDGAVLKASERMEW